ncbi:MAG: squalene cyclase, partial [Mesorhizobium sp.]
HYDILRALDYFRSASMLTGAEPDPPLADAIARLRSKCLADGTWPLDWTPKGQVWFEVDAGPGKPSKWVTLRAMRVLKWWKQRA